MVGPLRLVVALPAEARLWIRHYRLVPLNNKGFRVYGNGETALVVSGIGRLNAAAACGYLQAMSGDVPTAAWLNVGVGGYGPGSVGMLCQAVEVRYAETCWYPPQLLSPIGAVVSVETVDTPQRDYPDQRVYDMEAAAVLATASRFTTSELIQVVKIVSDCAAAPLGEGNRFATHQVEGWLETHRTTLVDYAEQLRELAAELTCINADPPHYLTMLAQWRLTTTQRHQLHQRLQRLAALAPNHPAPPTSLTDSQSLFAWLDEALRTAAERALHL